MECFTGVESCKVKLCEICGLPYRNTGECRLVHHLGFPGSTRMEKPCLGWCFRVHALIKASRVCEQKASGFFYLKAWGPLELSGSSERFGYVA